MLRMQELILKKTCPEKIIIRDSYEGFQILTKRKRNELEPWNFYGDFSSYF